MEKTPKGPTTMDSTGFNFKSDKPMYRVKFGDTTQTYHEEGLRYFIETAVIRNKDIRQFSVERIDSNSQKANQIQDLVKVIKECMKTMHEAVCAFDRIQYEI